MKQYLTNDSIKEKAPHIQIERSVISADTDLHVAEVLTRNQEDFLVPHLGCLGDLKTRINSLYAKARQAAVRHAEIENKSKVVVEGWND